MFIPESLDILLRTLRLPTMQRRWEPIQQRALQNNWSLPEYLYHLCEEELLTRE